MWYHLEPRGGGRITDAAWCYPEPTAGREDLKDHITFATGKGVSVTGPTAVAAPAAAARAGGGSQRRSKHGPTGGAGGGGDVAADHDSQASRGKPSKPGSTSTSPPAPLATRAADSSFIFDAAACSSKLSLANGGSTVLCHTNCGRAAQGTCFLARPFVAGRKYRVAVQVDSKPGRMCYFVGVAPKKFGVEEGQAAIRENREGVQGGHLNPLSVFLNPHGLLLTHLHTVCVEYSDRLPTLLNPLAERTCFSQAAIRAASFSLENLSAGLHGAPSLQSCCSLLAAAWPRWAVACWLRHAIADNQSSHRLTATVAL